MPAPSLQVSIGDRGAATPLPGDVSAWFAAGLTDRGPVGVVTECFSLAQVKETYGDVVTYGHLIRSAAQYFAQGGARMLVSRLAGPAATKGVLALAGSGTLMTLTAIGPGDWSTDLSVTITAGAGSDRVVTFEDNGDVLFSATFTSAAAMQDAFEDTGLVTVALGAGVWPATVLAETALSAGTDDRAAIPTTVAGWTTELDRFDADLDVGSVSLPGIATPAAHEALLRHGQTHKRFALLDAIDTATVASLTSPAGTLRALDEIAGYGQLLAPWITVPYLTGTVTIPPSGAIAGRMARADHENPEGPAQPAAASFGVLVGVSDVTREWSTADRDLLSDAGVTVIRNIAGEVQAYDDRTLADPDTWPQYDSVGGMRTVLAVYSESLAALRKYILKLIDGHGHVYSAVQKDLVGIGQKYYASDALFGDSAAEAFSATVIAGATSRSIRADLVLRPSESVNTVDLTITVIATGDTI